MIRNRKSQIFFYLRLSAFICGSTALAAAPEPKFRHQIIDDQIEIGYGVAAADVDADGKTDILLADKRQFVWYRNPTWQKFVIAENLTKRDNVCLAAQDLDGDGRCELALGSDWDPNDRESSGAVFYMIPPADRTQKWEAIKLHAEPTVHRMRWFQLRDRRWGLVVVPLHGRGKDPSASKILLYHKPHNPRDAWQVELLDDSMHLTHNLDIAGATRNSIIIGGREGFLAIAQDDAPARWHKRMLDAAIPDDFKGAGEVRSARFNVTLGFLPVLAAIEPMHGTQLVVYGIGPGRSVISGELAEGHALGWASVTGADNPDLIAGWRGNGGGVSVSTCLDPEKTILQWRHIIIDDGGMACEDLCLADLDGDGKLDIIASGRATKNVKIYWNETR